MSTIKAEDLNGYDRLLIVNGCKPEWMPKWINADLIFKPACTQHDIDYFAGGCEQDKKEADRIFLNSMIALVTAQNFNWFKRWWYTRAAHTYYKLVSKWGDSTFEYRYKKSGNKNIPFRLEKYDLPSYSIQADYRFLGGDFKGIKIKRVNERWYLASEEV